MRPQEIGNERCLSGTRVGGYERQWVLEISKKTLSKARPGQ
jgi:hypothetical protein